MVLADVWSLFEEKIFPLPSTSHKEAPLFNQYNDINTSVDLPNADRIRRENLRNYLHSFPERPDIVVIGEAPGWRGCRFSGVPFTSEAQLCSGDIPFEGFQSSKGAMPYSESTATVFWKQMLPYHPRFFAWNCIPFHPYEYDNILSNRTPKKEILVYIELFSEILSCIRPKRVVAVGRSAGRTLAKVGFSCSYVRHPSHGGANAFSEGIIRIFSDE